MEPTAAEFERAVSGNQADRARLLVYADSLTAKGDPLGALIVLQNTDREANPLLELELTTKVKQRLGSSRDLHALGVEWRWGFVDTLTLKGTKDGDNAALLSRVLESPACRFIRHLKISVAHLGGNKARDASWVADITGLDRLELLNRFTCSAGLKKFGEVVAKFPRLEHLSLGTDSLPAKKHFDLPLKSLELLGYGPNVDRLFVKPVWTELTHLRVEQDLDTVNEVLAQCPLSSLDLYGSQNVMANLVASPHLEKVQKLTLRRVGGVRPLVDARARLKHLTLHLIDGAATREDIGTLKASVKQLSYAGLYGPEGDAGYSLKIRV
ncbi:MAG: hypothetical protein JNM17_31900 [Archangium sp.]|nr:hypothetical protein [Archangium sp.]